MLVSLKVVKLLSIASNFNLSCIDIERKALLQFKEGLEDPSCRLSYWVGKNCYELKGVGCSKKGNVIRLDLGNLYTTAVPMDLMPKSEAKALEGSCLHVDANSFSRSIPTLIGRLSLLEELDLAFNKLNGTIPESIEQLKSLANFDNLRGEISKYLINLSYLGFLNLSRNQLIGMIPGMIGDLKLLETLDLSSNHLSGIIPSSMYSMTSLDHLNLSQNNLSGPIPSTNRFGTFIDPSIYEDNPELRGPLLPTNYSKLVDEGNKAKNDNRKDDGGWIEMLWFYSGIGVGFLFGF
ncbi:unnamed protein product [Dovyalis caffra]|uniref:Leucine-rich repeat receptor-like protein kinase n=1 Tax=Dovyalis caffra TaxID=77055 RepID=A0AAV1QY26_9ROSI|nr:unnamed protein product [Dovyalis caffra]